MDAPVLHPDAEQLTAFARGALSAEDIASIEAHLEQCAECCRTLSQAPDDSMIQLVRQSLSAAEPSLGNPSRRGETLALTGEVDHRAGGPQTFEATILGPDSTLSSIHISHLAATKASDIEPPRNLDLPRELLQHPRYRIVELLGRGGMGSVYKAEHKLMNRPVALKVINPQLVLNSKAVERFHREVQAAARLSHPNIVAAYDAEQAADLHFLVMEYVDGVDLAQVVKERGPLPVSEACDYVTQAAHGLQQAFECGMVHRDIKPHNLMLTFPQHRASADAALAEGRSPDSSRHGVIKVLDFGLANFAASAAGDAPTQEDELLIHGEVPELTTMGTMMGTPDYIAPEQARDAHSADIRADIYSLGCTLYCLLSGHAPFSSGTVLERVHAHTHRQAERLSKTREDVSAELDAVLEKMMAKDIGDRYQNPAEVIRALAPFVAKPERGVQTSMPRRGRWGVISVGLLGVLALCAGLIYIATDQGQLEIKTSVSDVKVIVSQDGRTVSIVDLATGDQVQRLPSGVYDIRLSDARSDVSIDRTRLTMTRAGTETVRISLKPNSPAVQVQTAADSLIKTPAELFPKAPAIPDTFRWTQQAGKEIRAAALSPDGSRALTCAWGGRISLWNTQTGQLIRDLAGGSQFQYRIAFLPDGRRAVSSSYYNLAHLWDLETGLELARFEGHTGPVSALALSPDGSRMLTGDQKGSMRLWDVEQKKQLHQVELGSVVWDVRFSADGRQALVAATSAGVRLWNIESWEEASRYNTADGNAMSVAFAGEGGAVVGTNTGKVTKFELKSGNQLHTLAIPDGRVVENLWVDPAGTLSVVVYGVPVGKSTPGSSVGCAILWEAASNHVLARLDGHDSHVIGLAVSPDGNWVLTSGSDGTARIWPLRANAKDVAAKQAVYRQHAFAQPGTPVNLVGHAAQAGVTRIRFLADGQRVITTGNDGTFRLWDVATGCELLKRNYPSPKVWFAGLIPKSDRVLITGDAPELQMWDLATGTLVKNLEGFIVSKTYIAVSPDGKRAAVCGGDRVSLWNLETASIEGFLVGHSATVWCAAWTPDGKSLATSSSDSTAKLWNAETRELIREYRGHRGETPFVSISPDGKLLATGSHDKTVRVWKLADAQLVSTFTGHDHAVQGTCFSPDGQTILSGSYNGVVRLSDPFTGSEILRLPMHSGYVGDVAFSPDGRLAASCGYDGLARIWRMPPLPAFVLQHRLEGHREWVHSVAFSPTTNELISASADETVRTWDPVAGKQIDLQQIHTDDVRSVACSSDGRWRASASHDRTIKLYDVAAREVRHTLIAHTGFVTSLAFSPDGRWLLSGSDDHTVKLWDVSEARLLDSASWCNDSVSTVSFSSDGKHVAAGGKDQIVLLSEVTEGKFRDPRRLQGHVAEIRGLAFSPDGKTLASCAREGAVRLWDVATGDLRIALAHKARPLFCVAWSPNGKLLAAGGGDWLYGAVTIWDASTHEAWLELGGASALIHSLAFSPDGTRLAAASADHTIRLWTRRDQQAVAPFDPREAAALQAHWAERINSPVQIENSVGMPLRLIPPGEFNMGSTPMQIERLLAEARTWQAPDWMMQETPLETSHRVRITKPSYLGVHEVTQSQFIAVMKHNPSSFSASGALAQHVRGTATEAHPVEQISWDMAVEFCRKLSERPEERAAGRVYRLPTEAEWEFACRCGSTTPYPLGDLRSTLSGQENLPDESRKALKGSPLRLLPWNDGYPFTAPVGQFPANAFGLHDMLGNVREWCSDWRDADYYRASPLEDPQGPEAGTMRISRGGTFEAFDTGRSAFRAAFLPGFRDPGTGFRVVCVLRDTANASSANGN